MPSLFLLVLAHPAYAQLTPLVVAFDDTDYRVIEGETLTLTVTLTPAADREVVVPIEATPHTVGFAAEADDYTVAGLTNGSLTFADGEDAKTFTITANHDDGVNIDDVKFGFGTLPDGVTASLATDIYAALVRILDEDFTWTANVREDHPRARRPAPLTSASRGSARRMIPKGLRSSIGAPVRTPSTSG